MAKFAKLLRKMIKRGFREGFNQFRKIEERLPNIRTSQFTGLTARKSTFPRNPLRTRSFRPSCRNLLTNLYNREDCRQRHRKIATTATIVSRRETTTLEPVASAGHTPLPTAGSVQSHPVPGRPFPQADLPVRPHRLLPSQNLSAFPYSRHRSA